jgi:hypothetical protein
MRSKKITGGLTIYEKSDRSKAIACLTNAFSEDPCLKYLLESDVYDPVKAAVIHEYTLKYGRLYGRIFTTGKTFEGISIWLPPESSTVSSFMNAWRFIRCGGLKMNKQITAPDMKDTVGKETGPEKGVEQIITDYIFY